MEPDIKIEELDLYELLDVQQNSSVSEIKTAYRKKALKCHPDKNPDNPNANKEFHKLLKVLEILTDEAARSAYDKVLKGRKEAALRHKELDGKRQKLKEDLEARERYYAGHSKGKSKSADQQLQEEIERLRKEGSKLVEEEMAYMQRKLQEESLTSVEEWDSAKHRIKIKWKSAKDDNSNGGYTNEMLHRFLQKYGDIEALVMSPRKKGSALVEFKTKNAAEMAVELEIGLPENPIKLEWVNGPPTSSTKPHSKLVKESDFESVVMTKMRQAEERKRLIAQMMAEDETDT